MTCNIALTCALAGCGGAAGSSGGEANVSDVAVPAPAPQPAAEVPVQQTTVASTADIVVSERFLMTSSAELVVNVGIGELEFERAYLNVCYPDGDGKLDYANCLINAPLRNGAYANTLTIPNDVDRLKMEIWRYSATQEPFSYSWQREQGMAWVVES